LRGQILVTLMNLTDYVASLCAARLDILLAAALTLRVAMYLATATACLRDHTEDSDQTCPLPILA